MWFFQSAPAQKSRIQRIAEKLNHKRPALGSNSGHQTKTRITDLTHQKKRSFTNPSPHQLKLTFPYPFFQNLCGFVLFITISRNCNKKDQKSIEKKPVAPGRALYVVGPAPKWGHVDIAPSGPHCYCEIESKVSTTVHRSFGHLLTCSLPTLLLCFLFWGFSCCFGVG